MNIGLAVGRGKSVAGAPHIATDTLTAMSLSSGRDIRGRRLTVDAYRSGLVPSSDASQPA